MPVFKEISDLKFQTWKFFSFRGYTLIELLLVIAIFGITISLVTASYLTFERNQRFRNAALQIKGDLRYAQNKALSGDKSSVKCTIDGYTLAGWYVRFNTGDPTSYYLNSDCKNTSGVEEPDAPVRVDMPAGVEICEIKAGSNIRTDVNVFFQPISVVGTFHLVSLPTPPFFDASGNLKVSENSPLSVYLKLSNGVCGDPDTYQVIIESTGEINEVRL